MKCIECGRIFSNPKWPAAWRARLGIYRRTGQINGHRNGAFTCSVKCNHAVETRRGIIYRLLHPVK